MDGGILKIIWNWLLSLPGTLATHKTTLILVLVCMCIALLLQVIFHLLDQHYCWRDLFLIKYEGQDRKMACLKRSKFSLEEWNKKFHSNRGHEPYTYAEFVKLRRTYNSVDELYDFYWNSIISDKRKYLSSIKYLFDEGECILYNQNTPDSINTLFSTLISAETNDWNKTDFCERMWNRYEKQWQRDKGKC